METNLINVLLLLQIFSQIAYLMLLAYYSNIKLFYVVACREDNRIFNLDDNLPPDCSNDVNSQFKRNYDGDMENFYNLLGDTRRKTTISKNKRTSLSPFFDSTSKTSCPCEVTFRLMDLGSGVYPRYVQTGTCKKNTCGILHHCQPKNYKIKLLKKRDTDTEFIEDFSELPEDHLPKSLEENWVAVHVKVVIDCECVPLKI